jgi:RNA polymerase sigma-70 factor (ECF subfamily)
LGTWLYRIATNAALMHRRASRARDGLARLPDLYRDAFVLRDLEELSTADVAQALGVEPATVRQRVHRARLMLRGYLSDLVGVEP